MRALTATASPDVLNWANPAASGRTACYLACLDGSDDVLRVLLDHAGVDVNKADDGGVSPLGAAASAGHEDCCRLLLALPAQRCHVNRQDNMGYSALAHAAVAGHVRVVHALLEDEGVDVELRTRAGKTAQELAEQIWKAGRGEAFRTIFRRLLA